MFGGLAENAYLCTRKTEKVMQRSLIFFINFTLWLHHGARSSVG